MTKEQVYDAMISPLMEQIIAICKHNKIAMIASFSLPDDEDDSLCCATLLVEKDFDPPDAYLAAARVLGMPRKGGE